MHSNDLTQDRVQWWTFVYTEMALRIPQHVVKFLSSVATDGFSRGTQSMELVGTMVS
jgi:hypothetical protein